MMFCYLNGQILKEEEAKVSIFDIGIMRGFGVYEAMTSFGLNILMWHDHFERFKKTADFVGIDIPETEDKIKKICLELIYKNGFKRSNIKFILTGGRAIEGIFYERNNPTFYILVEEWKTVDQKNYKEGARVGLAENLRQYPEYKTTDYITAVKAYSKTKQSGYLETLYFKENLILEFSTSNVFIVKDGVIITPEKNILKGITRKLAINLAEQNGFRVEVRDITLDEVYKADECFLTSSFKDIVPVVCILEKQIGEGKVGRVSHKMMSLFNDLVYNL